MINPFIDVINQILPHAQAALLSGILFGSRADFSKDLYDSLISTGTIHIVALSGQNISILTSLIAKTTLIFGRKKSILLTIAGVVSFVLFVGAEPPIVRAAIMGSLSLIATYFGRKNWGLLGLFLSAGIMLLIMPGWFFEISFQLSFLATLGIIIFAAKSLPKTNSIKTMLVSEAMLNLRISLAAQLFTLPLIFLYFKRVSLVAPLTNVLIAWTITPIMVLGFCVSLIGSIYLPLGKLIGWGVWVLLSYLLLVVELSAKLPFASIKFD